MAASVVLLVEARIPDTCPRAGASACHAPIRQGHLLARVRQQGKWMRRCLWRMEENIKKTQVRLWKTLWREDLGSATDDEIRRRRARRWFGAGEESKLSTEKR